MFTLPNGKPIDSDMIAEAMEDANRENVYYLNIETGEVIFYSPYADNPEEIEDLEEGIETNEAYVAIERISSRESYQWMDVFVTEIVAPKDSRIADKLYKALGGKGPFRRFKDALYFAGKEWEQAWYSWRDEQLKNAMREWFETLPLTISESEDTSEKTSS